MAAELAADYGPDAIHAARAMRDYANLRGEASLVELCLEVLEMLRRTFGASA